MPDVLVPLEEDSGPEPVTALRAFLFADIRGYTRYALEHGDEAELTTLFETVAAKAIQVRGGEVVETRGDQIVAAFTSARLALRAAVALQNHRSK